MNLCKAPRGSSVQHIMALCARLRGITREINFCSPSRVLGQGSPLERSQACRFGPGKTSLVWPPLEDVTQAAPCPPLTDTSMEAHRGPLSPCPTQPPSFTTQSLALLLSPASPGSLWLGGLKALSGGKGDRASVLPSESPGHWSFHDILLL